MRITSGLFGGFNLAVPKTDDIRPTQDMVRQALFSMLMTETPGAEVLDLFAGTGAFGLEAISRGAKSATFVEQNAKHRTVLEANIAKVRKAWESAGCEVRGAGRSPVLCATVLSQDAWRYAASYAGPGYDIVFADPPYADWAGKDIAVLAPCLKPGGLLIAEMSVGVAPTTVGGGALELVRDRKYGKTRICMWRKAGEKK